MYKSQAPDGYMLNETSPLHAADLLKLCRFFEMGMVLKRRTKDKSDVHLTKKKCKIYGLTLIKTCFLYTLLLGAEPCYLIYTENSRMMVKEWR